MKDLESLCLRRHPTKLLHQVVKMTICSAVSCCFRKYLTSLLLLLFFCSSYREVSGECRYIDYAGKKFNLTEVGCPSNNICNGTRVINVRYIEMPMYFYKEMKNDENKHNRFHQKPVHRLLRRCCGTCAKINQLPNLKNMAELTTTTLQDADFVYPVFSTASRAKIYGYYYIPLIETPGMMFKSEQPKFFLLNLFKEVWPISVVCILLCLVSGFVCWLLETWNNEEEFPRSFLIGWYEGVWWAFVSMTTVGYGDKTPKSVLGRFYALIWITIGMIAYGLLMGIVYTEVSKVNSPPPANMNGKQVGSLLYRDFDALMIGEKGANAIQNDPTFHILKRYPVSEFHHDFLRLCEKLEMKQIEGLAVDQFTFSYLYSWIYSVESILDKLIPDKDYLEWTKKRFAFFLNKVELVQVPQKTTQSFTYGILVKNHDDYLYFKDAAEDLGHRIRKEWMDTFRGILKHVEDQREQKKLFYSIKNQLFSDIEGGYFRATVKAVMFMVLAICLFGFAYEMMKRRGCDFLNDRFGSKDKDSSTTWMEFK